MAKQINSFYVKCTTSNCFYDYMVIISCLFLLLMYVHTYECLLTHVHLCVKKASELLFSHGDD